MSDSCGTKSTVNTEEVFDLSTALNPHSRSAVLAGLLAAAVAALTVLALTPSAPAEIVKPLVTLGPTTILNGVATVSGTLGPESSGAELTVNGQRLAVDAVGRFAGAVNLNGQSALTFSLKNPTTGRESTTTIPLSTNILGPGGILGPGILDALEQAAVALTEPIGGLNTDGLPIRIEGSVGDPASLASLKLNGQELLGSLDGNRGFSLELPGTTKVITLTATDRQGVYQTYTVPTSPTAATGTARTVAAAAANGVKIAKIRYITKSVRRTKRLRMVVTVKDRQGRLIRNAVISVRSKYARRLVRNPRVKKTNKVGQAAFLMKARNRAFGKRLVMVTLAKTPSAKASKATSVRIPKLRKAAARRK
jgi:hypothetical protein